MSYEENRAQIPKWLTKSYLQDVFRNSGFISQDAQVTGLVAEPAVAAGNNYSSLILRIKTPISERGVTTEKSVIIKTLPVDPDIAKLIIEYGAHTAEMVMYSDILPRTKKLMASIGDSNDLGAPSVHVDQENQAIIMFDLKALNFKLGDRKVGLDLDHMRVITKKHAKFHACSILLAEQGEKFPSFQRGFFHPDQHAFNPFFVNTLRELGEDLVNWPGFEKYGPKLVKLSEIAVAEGIDIFSRKSNMTLALNHGDSWVNNFMFKYDDKGHVNDAVMIDFQISVFASPIIDLVYFFYTSATDEIKFNHLKFHEMLKFYHETLVETLTLLKAKTKPPTLFQLHLEYYQRSFFCILATCIFTAMCNEKEESDMQNLIGTHEAARAFRRQLRLTPRFMRTIKHFLPIWDAQGLLDKE